jgi:hypothetical protein
VLVAALLAVGALLSMMMVDVARVTAARAQLAAAADAAALAAAPVTFTSFGVDTDPRSAATAIASANGATMVNCICPVDRTWSARTVVVVVAATVDLLFLKSIRLEAAAAAEFRPVELAR